MITIVIMIVIVMMVGDKGGRGWQRVVENWRGWKRV